VVLLRGGSQNRWVASATQLGDKTRVNMNTLLRLIVIMGLIGYGYYQYQESKPAAQTEIRHGRGVPKSMDSRCDGRQYCSQMTSCAEAKYFIRHCPDTKMDGDGDGVPCEQQWCN
jgi:hypothetical protein